MIKNFKQIRNGLLLVSLYLTMLSNQVLAQWSGSNLNQPTHRFGNVGIGTALPQLELHVRDNNDRNTSAVLFLEPSEWNSPGDYGEVRLGDRFHYIRGEFRLGMTFYDFNGMRFRVGEGNAPTRMFIDQNGLVGIGTNNPMFIRPNGSVGIGGLPILPDRPLTIGLGLGEPTIDYQTSDNRGWFSRVSENGSRQTFALGHYINPITSGPANVLEIVKNRIILPGFPLGFPIVDVNINNRLCMNANIKLEDYSIFAGGGTSIDFGNVGQGNEGDDITVDIADDGEFTVYANEERAFFVNNAGNVDGRVAFDFNVGIGTSSPRTRLDVRGDILALNSDVLLRQENNGNNDGMGLRYINGGTMAIVADGAVDFQESDNNLSRVYFDLNNGRVGIRTTAPTAPLTVNGRILAEEVEVIANVPSSDYVFEADYDLRSLEEVEAFVKENKHLPEVPSAQEFKENGYKLGDMDDLLLRKVEELTLYLIALKKENQQLKDRVKDLEKKK